MQNEAKSHIYSTNVAYQKTYKHNKRTLIQGVVDVLQKLK
jgi:hypothetical protein